MMAHRYLSLVFMTWLVGCSAGTVISTPHFVDGGSLDAAPDAAMDSGVEDFGIIEFDATALVGPLVIAPANTTITVTTGGTIPTQAFTATINGIPVAASWNIDRGEIGTITSGGGVLTPAGNLGGTAHITAMYNGMMGMTGVSVRLVSTQNGDPNFGTTTTFGPSGYGGVGGDGPGGPVTPTQQTTLSGTATPDLAVQMLYPYDQTVFPRGILPPLLQWASGTHAFDAVSVHISETNFDYTGTFTAPSSMTPFVNLPIPQSVWQALTLSNGGELVTITLTFAEGANAIGPITSHWKIAPALLQGTVYYNSYGTALASNFDGSYNGVNGGRFGGATLSIKPGSVVGPGGAVDPPRLVAGSTTSDHSGCRVCHSVSANGGVLMTQHGDGYSTSSFYDLTAGNTETVLSALSGIGFSALYPDGTMVLTGSGSPQYGGNAGAPSILASVPGGVGIPTTGMPANLGACLPAFSPDGKHVAFNFHGGTGADSRSLAVIDFDNPSKTFSNLRTIHTPTVGSTDDIFPSFLPTNDGVIFSIETNSTSFAATTNRSELWWVDLATMTPTRLDNLNGHGYLPVGANGHDNDETLNYEPTINPIASGGYVWVVFTSRRMYGNVATINPFSSDPRRFDWVANVTPKKLWVAAIDLNAAPGTDPSHPAFYLPAQELHGSNARGYWTVDPCHSDGTSCATGDECCGGYCRPDGTTGNLTCNSTVPVCAQVYERCTNNGDCCNSASGVSCISGVCTVTLG